MSSWKSTCSPIQISSASRHVASDSFAVSPAFMYSQCICSKRLPLTTENCSAKNGKVAANVWSPSIVDVDVDVVWVMIGCSKVYRVFSSVVFEINSYFFFISCGYRPLRPNTMPSVDLTVSFLRHHLISDHLTMWYCWSLVLHQLRFIRRR